MTLSQFYYSDGDLPVEEQPEFFAYERYEDIEM